MYVHAIKNSVRYNGDGQGPKVQYAMLVPNTVRHTCRGGVAHTGLRVHPLTTTTTNYVPQVRFQVHGSKSVTGTAEKVKSLRAYMVQEAWKRGSRAGLGLSGLKMLGQDMSEPCSVLSHVDFPFAMLTRIFR